MNESPPLLRIHLALGLLSIAVIAFQLVLMQILSITQWHHFAYMVISTALLGFGASGTVIALARQWLLERMDVLLPVLLFFGAASMAAAVSASQTVFGGFDSYLLFFETKQIWRLLLINLLFTVPFFLSALVIGLIFVRHVERIGTLYFANLLGSGLGGLVGVALMVFVLPNRLPAVMALFTLAAGFLVLSRRDNRLFAGALASAVVIAIFLVNPAPLLLSQYKDLRGALNLPEARIVAERPSPYGLVQAVSAPAMRFAPGLSLSYADRIPQRDALFNNGNAFGAIPLWPAGRQASPLDYTTSALPFTLANPDSVLVLHAGTGSKAAQALSRGAGRVIVVEPHRAALELLRQAYPASAGRLLKHPAVTVSVLEPRTFLSSDPSLYELIDLPTIGAFGGGAGLFAIQEQHTLTIEGIRSMWDHLASEGLLCLSAWLDYPPRNPLRLAATLVEALKAEGIDDPARHLVAVRSWGTVTFCVKRSPVTTQDAEKVRAFCRRLQFDPLLLPDLKPDERERFHRLQDPAFFSLLDRIVGPGREELYADYPFRLRPATDDRPFFSQFLRWKSLPRLTRLFGEHAVPFLEMGTLIVVLTFFQMAAAAIVLILLPLLRLGWRDGGRLRTFFYFGGLGIGFMLVEINLIHRFVLYLGHPVYAASAVICAVLIFSGAGSYASSRLAPGEAVPNRAAAIVAILILLYALILPPLIDLTIALPLPWKVLLTLLLLSPPSFAMGFPFPLGLQALSRRSEADVPWAWGINGCLSVLSTALATIIAVEAGFTVVFLVASVAYGAAALSGVRKTTS